MRVILVGLLLGALLPSVHAVAEEEAPFLRGDVLAVRHDPYVVEPGGDFVGSLELTRTSNVTHAFVQVCRVGSACFAPPVAATPTATGFTFRFSEGPSAGVRLGAGWHVGVRWFLNETTAEGTMLRAFPPLPECTSCDEDHYFTFYVAGSRDAPAFLPWMALLVAGWLRR